MEPTASAFLDSNLKNLYTLTPSKPQDLHRTSTALLSTFRHGLRSSRETMLPSYIHRLPTGREKGTAIALDLGGSNLRVAVIQLLRHGRIRGDGKSHMDELMTVVDRRSWKVTDDVKGFVSREFFDWIADKIEEVVGAAGLGNGRGTCMGVTWSFPIEQTSRASGDVQKMGKGYKQWAEIAGTDLKSHFDAAFARRGLNIRMNSLMNDTEATLLSHAYANPATRISLIWGTGLNAALQLPISVISPLKLGRRPREFTDVAKAVLVNTEVSMFGAGLFPLISADEELDRQSPLPGFQPLEYLTSGRYLGEIFRLALVEGVEVGTLFDGAMPKGLDEKFGFDTALMSHIETSSIEEATSLLTSAFSFTQPPEPTDIQAVRSLARAIASRAGVYIAITIFTLWRLQRDSLSANPSTRDAFSRSTGPVAVAYCGAVVEKHPSVRRQCQDALDILVQTEPGLKIRRRLVLEEAADSGVLGAAVGAVMNDIEDVQKEQQLIRARL